MKQQDWTGNSSTVWKIIGASNHTDKEREQDDYYATDPIAVKKLFEVTSTPPHKKMWECACGEGHLSEALRGLGFSVMSTDIRNRGYKHQDAVIDFLRATEAPIQGEFDILTNPPYKYALEFVQKSLELLQDGCHCYMFLKLTFCEGKKRYAELFKDNNPKYIYCFSERVLCAKNGEFDKMREAGGSAVAFAWFIWEKGYKGYTELRWL